MPKFSLVLIGLIACIALPGATSAMTMKDCGAAYQAARKAGTLGGASWTEFRKAQCLAETAETKPAPAAKGASPVETKDVAFPAAVDPKHAAESPGKARRLTCLAQYRANKPKGGNGSLKWQQKGGGYYSECNRRLKAAS